MIKYVLMILWLLVLFIVSRFVGEVHEIDKKTGLQTERYTKTFAIISVIPYIYWAAIRPLDFGDSRAYMRMYWGLPTNFADAWTYLQGVNKDPGFYALSILIKMFAGGNQMIYFGVIAAIQLIPMALILRKYSAGFITSIFIFIASTDYMSWVQNGTRQFTAVVMVFIAGQFLFEGKFIKYCIIVAFASVFHLSALMMIPVGLIAMGKPWRIRTFLLIAVVAVAMIYVGGVTDWLDDTLEGTPYENVVTDWESEGDDGTNPLRVLVYSVPAILSLIGLRYVRDAEDSTVNISCNMSIIASMIYVFSMLTSGLYVGRLPIYCSLFGMELLLPWLIGHMFSENSAKIVNMLMVVAFLLYYYYQMHYAWGVF